MFSKEFTNWGGQRRIDSSHPAVDAALAPIHDGASWHEWLSEWRAAYKALAAEIRSERRKMKGAGLSEAERSMAQSRRHGGRVAAANMMLLRDVIRERRAALQRAA